MSDIDAVDEQQQALAKRDDFPLEYSLLVLRDDDLPSRRLDVVGQVGRDNALACRASSRRAEKRSAGSGRADV